jgi:thiamine biosynthesis lipoprotein
MTCQRYVIAFHAMGSQFNVWLDTAADGAAILRRVPGWVEDIEARLTRFRAASELSRLNARSGKWVTASDTLFQAVAKARQIAHITGGLYNPLTLQALRAAGYTRSFSEMAHNLQHAPEPEAAFVPDWQGIELRPRQRAIRLPAGAQIDLGGMGKGWTAARIADRLAAYGPCLVDAGGDLMARGHPYGQPGWQIDISEPGPSTHQSPLATIVLTDAAVATSGIDYRRWTLNGKPQHHLIDPRTGQPAVTDVLSATVIHPDAALAEGYTKALILSGSRAGLAWLGSQPQQAALIARTDGAVLATSDFQAHITASATN